MTKRRDPEMPGKGTQKDVVAVRCPSPSDATARDRSKVKISEAALAADREQALVLTPVAPEVLARLDQFVARLLDARQTMNLVGDKTIHSLWTRHVADSLQLLALAPDAKVWVDLGSGAGFPGLVIACALLGMPGAMVHLVESTQKKARFLDETARALELPVTVHTVRIEQFMNEFHGGVQVVTARALAPLPRLLDYGEKLLKKGALGLFPKGQHLEAELTQASKYWTISYDLVPSKTSPDGRIVVVRQALKRAKSSRRKTIRPRNEAG